MANQSAKKNELRNVSRVKYLGYATGILIFWYILFESLTGSILSFKSFLVSAAVVSTTYLLCKQIIKSWELALPPEAYEYYMDIIAMNFLVLALSPLTSYVWHVYWTIPAYLLFIAGKWVWGYISTPQYVEEESEEMKAKKSKKEEKKQKVKYVKG